MRKKARTLKAIEQTKLESRQLPADQTQALPQPTAFLTLPRELRQKILYLSCSFELIISARRQGPHADRSKWGAKRVENSEIHHYTLWAQLRKVAVRDIAFWHDLDYVM